MSEPLRFCEPEADLEALIRSAKDFVRPSDDLRPRVLETARIERGERKMRRHFWHVAAVVFLCGVLTNSIRQPADSAAAGSQPSALKASEIFIRAEAASRAADPSWELVESFNQLRLRQAQLLRL